MGSGAHPQLVSVYPGQGIVSGARMRVITRRYAIEALHALVQLGFVCRSGRPAAAARITT